MIRRWLARHAPLILAALALAVLAAPAVARPGGGHSFSGGGGHSSSGGSRSYSSGSSRSSSSSSSSSSGSRSSSGYSGGGGYSGSYSGGGGYSSSYGGGGGFIFASPILWIVVLVVIIIIWINWAKNRKNSDWDSGPPVELEQTIELADLSGLDPMFSQVVFEDFIFRLFSAAHRARHSAEAIEQVAPYLGEHARGQLLARQPAGVPVQQVVVGAMRVFRLDVPNSPLGAGAKPNRVRIHIEFEANLATAEHTYYTVERWTLGRDANVHSKPPERARSFACPNCGAPWQATHTGSQICQSCGKMVNNGRFDWIVEATGVMSSDERPPTLTSETVERGTDLPTYRDRNLYPAMQALTADDPAVTEEALQQRLSLIYTTLNESWTSNELKPVRGLVSDGLFDYLQYWVDAYRAQGLRNVLEGMHITRSELAKVERDRYFDAVTIRLFATGKDYTINASTGERIVGSKHKNREYSEYWTLIRTSGRQGRVHLDPTCGNCGAPLSVGQSGACEHCGAHVTSGEFDWVLSKIEQDDTYRG